MLLRRLSRLQILFGFILLLGIFGRAWEFGSLPPGLNQDEASSAVDAYDLLRYGMDRNGETLPAHAIGYGSGQNIPYAYLMMPFILVGGLNPVTVRLPMLILGILTLPLVFYVGRKTAGDSFGLLAMLFIAVSPWHIILSRWGLDSAVLPFIFLAGFASLLKSNSVNYWFVLAGLFFGLSLYAYGSAYFVVPIVAGGGGLLLLASRRLRLAALLVGWGVLVIVGAPMLLYVLINTFKLDTLHIGLLTIPRLPVESRFEMMAAIFQPDVLHTMLNNARSTLSMLWRQTDRQPWFVLEPYGYFYTYTLPLAALGCIGLLPLAKKGHSIEKLLLLVWLVAAAGIGALEEVNINRINILFIPLIMSMAVPLLWLEGRLRYMRWVLIALLLASFTAFTVDYHGSQNRQRLGVYYFAGLLPAIDSARQVTDVPVCITGKVNMPYIDVLFEEPTPPAEFLKTVKYADAEAPFRFVTSFGRYSFGLDNCSKDPQTVFVLREETPPDKTISYQVESFGSFKVYKP